MKASEEQYHRAYGAHSRIPSCCIEFYVTEWYPNFENKWRETSFAKMIRDSHYNYVPCVSCFFTKQQIKIRICADECGKDCYKEF
jgi:hypothetical protein